MNTQLAKLSAIAASSSRIIIGLMSGTSLDGLDIALCEFSGSGTDTKVKVLNFTTVPYAESFKEELKSISFKSQVSLQQLTLLHAVLGSLSAEMIFNALRKWDFPIDSVDLIASHGQTIFHAPSSLHQLAEYPNATLQIGDGDHIAVRTGIITLSDFRQKHIA
ncbi:MAG: anhydro-N-acetylmuramic acid kinase, partial [Pedobacter sp.]|nr:anhydro-N-acetylmuramic acid kinase [Pedobacter sp.]